MSVSAGDGDPGVESSSSHDHQDELELLNRGEIEVQGRIMPASNATFFATVALDGETIECVYKPVAGERPLWDFPDGTLAGREVAAYLVSDALGWRVVPPTVLRGDAPAGTGMVQAWREPDVDQDPVDLVPTQSVPEGYLHVLDAYDGNDRPVSLVHEDCDPLRRMAVFDVVVNNADRKGTGSVSTTASRSTSTTSCARCCGAGRGSPWTPTTPTASARWSTSCAARAACCAATCRDWSRATRWPRLCVAASGCCAAT
jgi:hypothetical protein